MKTQKYFLYARKSTDVEDKQVLSIEAQIVELRAFARNEGLHIIEELVEKKSAKMPGRPIFNSMLDRIENGEAQGIVSWAPDRLARNSVDGGRIIYLFDCGHLAILKFPTFWAENTSQGKFMLSIAFGQSKYYVDSLAENVRRGLRQKVRRGEYPGIAPIGYLNDPRTKTIVVDRKRSKLIKQAFELYAKNESRLEDVVDFLSHHGVSSRNGKRLKRDRISFILSNPFYVGLFRYCGETYEGTHQPIISKRLFDSAQVILKERGRPHKKPKNKPKAFCGLLTCTECGMGITAEMQKGHTYYRCTKKHGKCSQPYVREESLDTQLSDLLEKSALSTKWAEELTALLEQDRKNSAHSVMAFVKESHSKIKAIEMKLHRLLDSYLEQDVEREVYLAKKTELLSEKKSLQEQASSLEQTQTGWLEPMQEWIKEAQNLARIARGSDLFGKKVVCRKVFGSNLTLADRTVRLTEPQRGSVTGQNPWSALRAANAKAGKKPNSLIVVTLPGIEPGFSP